MHPYVHYRSFTIAKIWKQPKCPSMDEWINKIFYVYTHTRTHTHKEMGWVMMEFPVNQHSEGSQGLIVIQGLISVAFLCLLWSSSLALFKRRVKHKAQVIKLNVAKFLLWN